MPKLIEVKNLHLAHHKNESITITHIEQPHGEYSDPVVSIGTSHHGKKNTATIEIPYENIDEVIIALVESKKVCSKFMHEDLHSELDSDMGGGQ